MFGHRQQHSPSWITRRCLLFTLLLSLIGCGGGDAPELGSVSGTVTLDGSPLEEATVEFHPVDGGRSSSAITDEEGHYTLQFAPKRDGALIGKHQVKITTSIVGDDNVVKERVPTKYNTETTLEKEVVAGENEIDFDLDSEGSVQQPGQSKPSKQAQDVCM